MQTDALDEINLKPKKRAVRLFKSSAARLRRREMKEVRETRLLNKFAKLRRQRKKG